MIHNDIFKTKVSGGGFGSEMVGRQMEQAAKLGAKHVDDLRGPRRRLRRLQGVAQVWLRRPELSSGIRSQLRGASELPASVRNATKSATSTSRRKGSSGGKQEREQGMSMSFDLTAGELLHEEDGLVPGGAT